MKVQLNKTDFYYNELAKNIADDIFENLKLGIKYDQTQYEWPYELLIDVEPDVKYFNFTFSIERIPKKHFIKNDIIATSGLDEFMMPHIKMQMLFEEKKWIKKHNYSYDQVIGVVSHELHHLTQDFDLVEHSESKSFVDYFLNPIEVEAFHIGFRAESAYSGNSIEECIKKYLDNFLNDDRINQKEYEKILVKWLNPEIKLLKGVNNES